MTQHQLSVRFGNDELHEYKADIRSFYDMNLNIVDAVESHITYEKYLGLYTRVIEDLYELHKVAICVSEAVDDSVADSEHPTTVKYAYHMRVMGRYFSSIAHNLECSQP